MKQPLLVHTQSQLGALVDRAAKASVLAVDTEANTLHAYRERLCLLQLTFDDVDALVDPLAGLDLSPLATLFADVSIQKVFHDAEGDVGLLRRAWPFEIRGLFDTKIAAAALGLPTGLAPLLEQRYGVHLDKRLQRSDWGRRPLSREQVEYASQDTHHLPRLARDLRALLVAADVERQLDFAAECRRLETWLPEPRRFDADDAFAIRGAETLDATARRALRSLFEMRHRIADAEDRPAFKVLGNEMLIALATHRPTNAAGLAAVRELPPKLADRHGDEILAALQTAHEQGPLERTRKSAESGEGLQGAQSDVYEALRAWRKRTADERGTDPSLVLPKSTMLRLARLDPAPRDLDALAETRLLEPFRLHRHGERILAAFAAAPQPRRRTGASRRRR